MIIFAKIKQSDGEILDLHLTIHFVTVSMQVKVNGIFQASVTFKY